jgi:hypothetical protein
VPEAQFRTGNLFWALGQHGALGYSIFGIEDGKPDSQLAQAYALLANMDGVITRAQAEKRIAGILIDDGKPAEIHLGGYTITVRETQVLLKQMLLDAGLQAPLRPRLCPARPSMASQRRGMAARSALSSMRAKAAFWL